jgi:YD repeat-containing protein
MGGGGGVAALGGDLGGTTSSGYVKLVRGLSAVLAYDADDVLLSKTTASGTQTFNYNPDGTLASITGTSRYPNKTFTYTDGLLTDITVA